MAIDCTDPKRDYRPASFKGVTFLVTTESAEVGRRGDSYEFPLGENVGWRDLGRRARTFSVSGYVAGADHHEQARRLADIAQSTGPGLLVHPIYGEVMVACRSLSLSNDIQGARRRTDLTFDFIETGSGATFPGIGGGLLSFIGQIDGFISAARGIFAKKWGEAGAGAALAAISRRAVSGVAKASKAALWASVAANEDTIDAFRWAEEMATAPRLDGDDVLFMVHGPLEAIYEHGRTPHEAMREIEGIIEAAPDASTAGRAALQVEALREVTRRLGAAYYVLAATDIDNPTVGGIMDALNYALGVLDDEAQAASEKCDDEAVAAINDMRQAAIEKMFEMIFSAPGEVTYAYPVEIDDGWPSLMVAHHVYGDSRRAAEIEHNNPSAWPAAFGRHIRLFTEA